MTIDRNRYVSIFAQFKYGDDWAQALPEVTKIRIPDIHALRELSDN